MEESKLYNRYHRQIILNGFGMAAQKKLLAARVLVIGAGGLGCPVLMALAGAGVGKIGIVDDGMVELSNLHRQLLYHTADIGQQKVACATRVLKAMNPDIEVVGYPIRLMAGNAMDVLQDYDVIIDGTDNFQTRYMVNDACALLRKPLLYGAIARYEGQVALFQHPVNYRDLFPYPPREGEVQNCSEAGVLGVLPGIIGNFMANECIKFLTGTGETLSGKLLTYSLLDNQCFILDVSPTRLGTQLIPKDQAAFEATDYPALCGFAAEAADEIDAPHFRILLAQGEIDVVDVREMHEQPDLDVTNHLRIPLSGFSEGMKRIQKDTVVFICQSGKRSLQAANAFEASNNRGAKRIYSLRGGVNALIGKDFGFKP